MTWLVTGGAGYIGAHIVHALWDAGEQVVVFDDLSTGDAVRVPTGVKLFRGSILDGELLRDVMSDHAVKGVIHLAAKKQVGESVERPLLYFQQNVEGLRVLLGACVASQVTSFVFSSSAAVYGTSASAFVTEEEPCHPENPYGETKLIGEWMVRDVANVQGFRYANLRYFNVAGTVRPDLADIGVFNLIPMVFDRLTAGEPPKIFGDDYPTPDGTCIRDYIHVADVAEAHVMTARALSAGQLSGATLNVGRGEGVSVKEMMNLILDVTGHEAVPTVVPRRPGDPARTVASPERIQAALGWRARHDVRSMVESAWNGWIARHPGSLPRSQRQAP